LALIHIAFTLPPLVSIEQIPPMFGISPTPRACIALSGHAMLRKQEILFDVDQ
jgi:hypothetical protein